MRMRARRIGGWYLRAGPQDTTTGTPGWSAHHFDNSGSTRRLWKYGLGFLTEQCSVSASDAQSWLSCRRMQHFLGRPGQVKADLLEPSGECYWWLVGLDCQRGPEDDRQRSASDGQWDASQNAPL